jgi:phosphatidylglycerophosphate synthase
MDTIIFEDAAREQLGLLASAERRALHWLARRTPPWVNSDHLTLLGFSAMFLAGLFYYFSRWNPLFLLVVNGWLTVNWLGDSLDGTLARYRKKQRPRYGFYVDHMVDTCGALFLISGLAVSNYMSGKVAYATLLVFFMLSINVYLGAYTLGKFKISFGKLSPTELRLALVIGNPVLLYRPKIRILGQSHLLFDVGGAVSIAVMSVILISSVIQNTRALYRLERV